jgi:hypothetical protein
MKMKRMIRKTKINRNLKTLINVKSRNKEKNKRQKNIKKEKKKFKLK